MSKFSCPRCSTWVEEQAATYLRSENILEGTPVNVYECPACEGEFGDIEVNE